MFELRVPRVEVVGQEKLVEQKRKEKVAERKRKESLRGGPKHSSTKEHRDDAEEVNMLDLMDLIVCGDSEVVLKDFPSSCVDIIVTSPPYNFGLQYEGDESGDAVCWRSYFEKLNRTWRQCCRVLKPGGRLCVNIQPSFSDGVPTHHIVSNQLLELELFWKAEILWEKHNYSCPVSVSGSWKSPSAPYLKYTWEFVEVFCKGTYKKTGDSSKVDITADEFSKWTYAKWHVLPEGNIEKFKHPAVFPEELVTRLLKLFSYQGDVVLDPFNGVGTTTLVAHKLKRRYVGIDISREYCRMAEKRLKIEKYRPRLSIDI